MPSPTLTARRDTLSLRIKPEDQGLIDRAAQLTGKTKTVFVLDAARQAAEDALLDQTRFPRLNERLRRSLQTPAPWE